MFGTGHPQPPHRKEVAMQVVQQQQRDFDAHRLQIDPPGGDVAPPPPGAQALVFDVTTTLTEYLGFVRDHLAFTLRRMPRARRLRQTLGPLAVALLAASAAWSVDPGWLRMACSAIGAGALACLPPTAGAWIRLIGTPLFLLKRRGMPVNRLRIDGAGIARTTRAGTQVRTWADIEGIRRYRHGYLLMFAKGGVVVPFRCMDRQQTALFRQFAAQRN